MIDWGWGNNLDWVSWSWWVMSLTLVFHVSNVSSISIDIVGDNLGATIGESNTVFTRGGVSIPVLILGKVGARVVVSDSISVLVDWSSNRLNWSMVWGWVGNNNWSRVGHNNGSGVGHKDWSSGAGQSGGKEGREGSNKSLEEVC